jgi:DNA primase
MRTLPAHMIDGINIEAIKARVSVLDVIAPHVALKPRGREHIGLCPFHCEKTPSFTVNDAKGFFHCFGCGAHGDVIDFTVKFGNVLFTEAVARLRADAGITRALTPEEIAELECQRREREEREARELQEKIDAAYSTWASAAPIACTPAEAYLLGRGIDPLKLLDRTWPRTLRYATNAMESGKRRLPGLVMAVGSRDGKFRGLQRVFLHPNGKPVLQDDGSKLKLSLGDIRGGSAKFTAAGPDPQGRWGIAEGGENAIAAQQLYQFPVEAGISSGNMQNVVPPAWARRVAIFADHDGAGFIAAQNCRQRYLVITSIETVSVLTANKPGADVCDVLIEGTTAHAA